MKLGPSLFFLAVILLGVLLKTREAFRVFQTSINNGYLGTHFDTKQLPEGALCGYTAQCKEGLKCKLSTGFQLRSKESVVSTKWGNCLK
jgi:hypothetical protein